MLRNTIVCVVIFIFRCQMSNTTLKHKPSAIRIFFIHYSALKQFKYTKVYVIIKVASVGQIILGFVTKIQQYSRNMCVFQIYQQHREYLFVSESKASFSTRCSLRIAPASVTSHFVSVEVLKVHFGPSSLCCFRNRSFFFFFFLKVQPESMVSVYILFHLSPKRKLSGVQTKSLNSDLFN